MTRDQLYEVLSEITGLENTLSLQLTDPGNYSKTSYKKQLVTIISKGYIHDELQKLTVPQNKLLNTDHTRLSIVLTLNCIQYKMDFLPVLKFLSRIYYISFMRKVIPYPNKTILNNSFSRLKSTHAFKNGIIEGLDRLCETIHRRFQRIRNLNEVIKMMYYLRTSVAQSCKSLASKYYSVKSESKTVVDRSYIDNQVRSILSHRIDIRIPQNCEYLAHNLTRISSIDYDVLYSTIEELLTILGTDPSTIKIQKNIHKLHNAKRCTVLLGITPDEKNMLCLINTLLLILKDHEQNK